MKKILFAVIMIGSIQLCTAQDIVISTPTTVNTAWNLGGKTLRFEAGGFITGNGSLTNGSVDANYNQYIFDANISVQLLPSHEYYSACWFGASPSNSDNSFALQRAINTCLAQAVPVPLFIPARGVYTYSTPLLIANVTAFSNGVPTSFGQVTFHMSGGTQFWSAGNITTLSFTGIGDTHAIDIQGAKGVEINNLKITGRYTPPQTGAEKFFITPTNYYLDWNGLCTDNYSGIVVDPYTGTGSTGIKIHDVWVSNFAVDFSISPAGSANSDILIFDNIHVGESKYGFQSGYAQSKGNVVRGLYSWGRMHTLISIGKSGRFQAGFWTFDGGNIAGNCIRLFDISAGGWYATNILNYYSESIGCIGTILTSGNGYIEPPIYLQGCNFNFNPSTPPQVLLRTLNGRCKFESCTFRFYTGTYPTTMLVFNYINAPATFSNCTFSGPVGQNTTIFQMN